MVIALPRPWLLASAFLVGAAAGMLTGVAMTLLVQSAVRPDVAIGLVVGVPGSIGMLLILASARRWITTVGAFFLGVAPGWFGALVMIQVVHGG